MAVYSIPKPATKVALLSCREFAALLGLNEWTIRHWAYDGRIASVKIGKARKSILRIPASEFDRIVAENLRPAVKSFQRAHGRKNRTAGN